ncbi:MAG: N-acetylmuramoyl-L-alanine amidase [Acidobacteriota bacterium]
MSFSVSDHFLIPVADGHAVGEGWTADTEFRPRAVTWHWTATRSLHECSRLLGGPNALRKGLASAHYGVGRSYQEGIHRYVALDNRSWHAGKNQTVRWDGEACRSAADKGHRTAIGIETVNVGYARAGFPADSDWSRADSPHGRWQMRIQPWTEAQIHMMIALGREIVARWPHIGPRDHHGHHDLCPDYKVDPVGFPFTRVLRGIYDDADLPDVWTPYWTARQRRAALVELGYGLGPGGRWDDDCDRALRDLQAAEGLLVNGRWSTFVSWRVHRLLGSR